MNGTIKKILFWDSLVGMNGDILYSINRNSLVDMNGGVAWQDRHQHPLSASVLPLLLTDYHQKMAPFAPNKCIYFALDMYSYFLQGVNICPKNLKLSTWKSLVFSNCLAYAQSENIENARQTAFYSPLVASASASALWISALIEIISCIVHIQWCDNYEL